MNNVVKQRSSHYRRMAEALVETLGDTGVLEAPAEIVQLKAVLDKHSKSLERRAQGADETVRAIERLAKGLEAQAEAVSELAAGVQAVCKALGQMAVEGRHQPKRKALITHADGAVTRMEIE